MMLRRTLLREPARTTLNVLAVASAVALVLLFEGFRVGLYEQIRSFPAALPADLVAVQAGVSNVLGARSILPRGARAEVEAVPGVRVAHPLAGIPLIYSRGERVSPIYVVAYDTAGGPRRLSRGRGIVETGEVVIDAALASKYRLGPGDAVELLGYRFTIAGLSADGTNFFDPYVFVRLVDLVDLYMAGDLPGDLPLDAALSFLLIELEPASDRDGVRAAIERKVDSVDVFTPAELAENDVERTRGFMGPPLDILVVVAYVVGALIVGLTLYASVADRMRDFGIMKAIGAPGIRLGREVIGEALVVSALAVGLGVALTLAVAAVLRWTMPAYLVVPLEAPVLVRTMLAVVAMATFGALLPVHRAVTVDPMLVFTQAE